MTKQEAYQCDWCFEILHVPQRSLHKLQLTQFSGDVLEWDLCSECRDKFMEFLEKKIYAEEETE